MLIFYTQRSLWITFHAKVIHKVFCCSYMIDKLGDGDRGRQFWWAEVHKLDATIVVYLRRPWPGIMQRGIRTRRSCLAVGQRTPLGVC